MAARKAPKPQIPKNGIDWSTAFIGWGFGVACMGIAWLVYWAATTGTASGPSGNALRTSQRIVALLPSSIKQKLAIGFSVLMFLGGIFLFGMACIGFAKDILYRNKP